MKTNVVLSMFLFLSVPASTVWAYPANPTLSNITSTTIHIGGTDYYSVKAIMNGTGVAGPAPYNVPVEFLYPVAPGQCNGTGIVDLLNNSAMVLLASTGVAVRPLASARARLTEEFIAKKRYFYVSAQWEKTRGATDVIGLANQLFGTNYVIPTAVDQFAIVLDAASLVKTPPAGLPGSPCAVAKAIGYGFSASTQPLLALRDPTLSGPVLSGAFTALYDGVLLDSITSGFLPFPISKTGVKTIAVSSETDVELFRNDVKVRGENATYRAYEIAGTTHVTMDQHDFADIVPLLPFVPSPPIRQNLQRDSTVFRAMMEHLRRWTSDGTPPPPSVYLDGSNYGNIPLSCVGLPIPGIAAIPRDADGNALGGIRLPHMKTEIDGKTVGSPLGHYNGIESQYGCSAGGFPQAIIVTGTFVRDDEIIGRYKNHGKYVSGVSKAAEYAADQGWILAEDAEEYSRSAAHCAVGHAPADSVTLDDLRDCHSL